MEGRRGTKREKLGRGRIVPGSLLQAEGRLYTAGAGRIRRVSLFVAPRFLKFQKLGDKGKLGHPSRAITRASNKGGSQQIG